MYEWCIFLQDFCKGEASEAYHMCSEVNMNNGAELAQLNVDMIRKKAKKKQLRAE